MGPQPPVGCVDRRLSPVRLALLAFALGCAATASLAQTHPEATQGPSVAGRPQGFSAPASQFAGSDRCRNCHKSEAVKYDVTSHWNNILPGKDYVHGCETCHGPAKDHSDAVQAAHGDDAATAKALKDYPVFSFQGAAKEINARCLTCHAGGTQHMNAINSEHSKNDVSCASCHSAHRSETHDFLLKKSQPELCYTCHLQQRAQFDMPFHHRVNEGLVRCSDCHNVHGTVKPKQVRTSATQDAICFTCHTDKQGPFVFEHQTVKIDGCQSCHVTHGGPNPHMLKLSNVNLLCLQCHTTSSFSSAPGAPSFHNQASFFQSCVLCHSQVHGSNFDPFFFK
jgi:DmsE family decaheme c-type cytochrome